MSWRIRAIQESGKINDIAVTDRLARVLMGLDGGEGSGNFGHKGRPGKVGGSGESSGGGQKFKESETQFEFSVPSKVVYAPPAKGTEKTLGGFAQYAEAKNRKILHDYGYSDKDIEEATKVLEDIFEQNEFGMYISSDSIDKVLSSGSFKNFFQTKRSGGTESVSARKSCSKNLFGANPEDMKPRQFEKYGCLIGRPTEADLYMSYGDCAVTFDKEKLAGKVTYTLTDSLYLDRSAAGSVNVDKTTFGGFWEPSVLDRIRAIPKEKRGDLDAVCNALGSPMLELQYHGDIPSDYITSICYREKERLTAHLDADKIKSLKEKGVKISYLENDEVVYV